MIFAGQVMWVSGRLVDLMQCAENLCHDKATLSNDREGSAETLNSEVAKGTKLIGHEFLFIGP